MVSDVTPQHPDIRQLVGLFAPALAPPLNPAVGVAFPRMAAGARGPGFPAAAPVGPTERASSAPPAPPLRPLPRIGPAERLTAGCPATSLPAGVGLGAVSMQRDSRTPIEVLRSIVAVKTRPTIRPHSLRATVL